jgi:DNA polymerase-3 subunit epsilon
MTGPLPPQSMDGVHPEESAFWSEPGRLVVIDFETTQAWDGLRAVEIALVVVENGTVRSTGSHLIQPGCSIDPFSQAVHGIRDSDVRGAPRFAEVWEGVAPQLDGAVLVAHNASFDARVLATELARGGLDPGAPGWWCTLRMARRLWKGQFGSFRLGALCEALRLPVRSTHRAEADALAALELLRAGGREARRRGHQRLVELEPLAAYRPGRRG